MRASTKKQTHKHTHVHTYSHHRRFHHHHSYHYHHHHYHHRHQHKAREHKERPSARMSTVCLFRDPREAKHNTTELHPNAGCSVVRIEPCSSDHGYGAEPASEGDPLNKTLLWTLVCRHHGASKTIHLMHNWNRLSNSWFGIRTKQDCCLLAAHRPDSIQNVSWTILLIHSYL